MGNRFIKTKNIINIEDINKYLTETNNKFFSGLLKIEKYQNNKFKISYDDTYFTEMLIYDDLKTVSLSSNDNSMNSVIKNIFSHYIASKYSNFNKKDMDYEKILYDDLDEKYISILDEKNIKLFFKYTLISMSNLSDYDKIFINKINRNKILNKIKNLLNLY